MSNLTIAQAQANMREGYFSGAPGVLISGVIWLVAGLFAFSVSGTSAVFALLIGGALIHPASVVASRLLGRPGKHAEGNPLGRLAVEGTFWLLAGIAIAYGMQALRLEWFFPAMLLVIGGRYLSFQTLYGVRLYWVLGAVLCAAGLVLALARAAPAVSAWVGGVVEVIFAAVLFLQAAGDRSR